jgi:dolichyl-phosphate-mannose-protein mannosyltransferase
MNKLEYLSDNKELLFKYGQIFLFILIYAVYLFRVEQYFDRPVAPDALKVYLPLSRLFLEEGFSFLFNPAFITVAPLAYIWPAIFGGDIELIKLANIFAGMLMILCTYGIGKQLHSAVAGLIAAFLFARSPLIIHWIPTVLSEPPFYLFTIIWLWSIYEVISNKKWAIPVFALALGLSILTRPVWFYPAIVFFIGTSFWLIFINANKQVAKNLSIALLCSLILPMIIIIKNTVIFGLPSITTASGAALFYGTNIITNGFEPPLLGLSYENGPALVSILGNKEHASVAIQFLNERTISELINWFVTKISWVTMFSSLDASINQTIWRILELMMTLVCVWYGVKKRNFYIVLLFVALILQILQTSLALYNMRYSADSLELILMPMAAAGIAVMINTAINFLKKGKAFFTKEILFNSGLGIFLMLLFIMAYHYRPIPDINLPKNIPVTVIYSNENIQLDYDSNELDDLQYLAEINVPQQDMPDGFSNALWQVKLSGITDESDCRTLSISFDSNVSGSLNSTVYKKDITGKSEKQTYLYGAAPGFSKLFPDEEGKVLLKVECSNTANIVIDNISLVAPHFIETYFKNRT